MKRVQILMRDGYKNSQFICMSQAGVRYDARPWGGLLLLIQLEPGRRAGEHLSRRHVASLMYGDELGKMNSVAGVLGAAMN